MYINSVCLLAGQYEKGKDVGCNVVVCKVGKGIICVTNRGKSSGTHFVLVFLLYIKLSFQKQNSLTTK